MVKAVVHLGGGVHSEHPHCGSCATTVCANIGRSVSAIPSSSTKRQVFIVVTSFYSPSSPGNSRASFFRAFCSDKGEVHPRSDVPVCSGFFVLLGKFGRLNLHVALSDFPGELSPRVRFVPVTNYVCTGALHSVLRIFPLTPHGHGQGGTGTVGKMSFRVTFHRLRGKRVCPYFIHFTCPSKKT